MSRRFLSDIKPDKDAQKKFEYSVRFIEKMGSCKGVKETEPSDFAESPAEGERVLPDLNQILPWLDRIWDLRDMLPELKS